MRFFSNTPTLIMYQFYRNESSYAGQTFIHKVKLTNGDTRRGRERREERVVGWRREGGGGRHILSS